MRYDFLLFIGRVLPGCLSDLYLTQHLVLLPYLTLYFISASWLDRARTYNYLINSQAFYPLNYKPVMRVKSKEWQHPLFWMYYIKLGKKSISISNEIEVVGARFELAYVPKLSYYNCQTTVSNLFYRAMPCTIRFTAFHRQLILQGVLALF